MGIESDKTNFPEFFRTDGQARSMSTGRSNCTIFLDHPEFLSGWLLHAIELPKDVYVPACFRRVPLVAGRKLG